MLRQAAQVTGARRLLLVLGDNATLHIEASLLPRGEDAATLLHAITPWLAEAQATRKPRLRHGPIGVARAAQRSCIVAPLVVQRRVLGVLYADIDGAFGRFDARQRDMLAALAAQAASALANAQETKARNAELAVINSIQHGMAAELDFEALVDLAGDKLREVLGTRDIAILWLAPDTGLVHTLYAYERGVRLHLPPQPPRPGGPGERMLRTRKPVVYRTLAETLADGSAARPGTQQALSSIMVPIPGKQRVLGCIALDDFEREHAFGPNEERLLGTVASGMGVALDNVRLFNETQAALQRQTASADILRVISQSPTDVMPVVDVIVASARRLLGCFVSAVFLHREGKGLVGFLAHREQGLHGIASALPLDPAHNFPARAFVNKTMLHTPDWAAAELPATERMACARGSVRTRSSLLLPLLRGAEREPLGVLTFERDKPEPFSETDIALAQSFADQAVIAIENVRLFNETQEALNHQTASADILRVISASPTDTQPVFNAITATAVRILGCDRAAFSRVEGSHYVPCSIATPEGSENDRWTEPVPIDAAANFPSQAIMSKQLVHIPDWDAVELPERQKMIRATTGARASLAVPLLHGGQSIGVLMLFRNRPGGFTPKEIALAESFRDQAVIAIANARLFNETKEALEQQMATSEVLEVMSNSPTDVQPVLDAVAHRAALLCDATAAQIFLLEDGMLHSRAGHFPFGEAMRLRGDPVPIQNTSMTGRAVLERTTIHCADVLPLIDSQYPAARANQQRLAFRAILAVPLTREGGAYGAIFLHREEPRAFLPGQIALVETFARQAAIAIENVRLFNETKDALRKVEERTGELTESLDYQTAISDVLRVISESPTNVTPVFEAILDSAAHLFGTSIGAVFSYDGSQAHLMATTGWSPEALEDARRFYPGAPNPAMMTGRVLLSGEVQVIEDTAADPRYDKQTSRTGQWRRMLGAPMLKNGVPVGVLVVAWHEPGEIARRQIDLLKTFADQAVIAIENVRLINETREALERQTATAEVLQVISSSIADTQPVFDKILDSCRHLFASENLFIQLIGDDHQLRLAAYNGAERADFERTYPIPVEGSAAERAIQARSVHQYIDVLNGADVPAGLRRFAEQYGKGSYSLMIAPMLWEGRGMGTINILRSPPRPSSRKDVELLSAFANQAVIAIQNARLFNETREALERQTATSDVLQVINASPGDLKPVFDAIVSNALRLCDASFGGLFLVEGGTARPHGLFGGNVPQAYVDWLASAAVPVTHLLGRDPLSRPYLHLADVATSEAYQLRLPIAVAGVELGRGRASLFVPLIEAGTITGVLALSRQEVRPFSDKQIGLLQAFATQAQIAMKNARLINETQEALEQQTATAEVLGVISNSVADTAPVFEAIVRSCQRLFEGANAIISLVNGDGMVHHEAAAASAPLTAEYVLRSLNERGFPLPLDQTYQSYAIRKRRVVHYPDMLGGPKVPEAMRQMAREIGNFSMLIAPMLWEGRGIGTIHVTRIPPVPFDDREADLLRTFADQAVIAIQNARLFNETREALERQTGTAEILKVIAGSPSDVQPVFEAIAAA